MRRKSAGPAWASKSGEQRTSVRRTAYRRSWRDLAAKYRRPVAACLAAIAVACGLSAVAPERAETLRVPVAAQDLPAGHLLSPQDVDYAEVLAEALPPELRGQPGEADPVLEGQLAIATRAGTPLHEGLLVGDHLLAGTAPGTVAVPLQPADPQTLELLAPGHHVDVVLTEGNGYEEPLASSRVASGLAVLWVPGSGGSAGILTSGSRPEGTVVVAATSAEAEELAAAASRGRLQLLLVSAPQNEPRS